MLRYILLGVTVTVSVIAVQLYWNGQVSDSTEIESIAKANSAQSPWLKSQPSTSTSRKGDDSTNQGSAVVSVSYSPGEATKLNPQAWQHDTSAPLPPTRFTNKGITPMPLKIDKQQISSATVGGTLTLPIPQVDQAYEMSVRKIGEHRNGDKTLKGHLVSQPEYTVVVTEGQQSTYATINTPEGSFLLEANQEQGWLMAAVELDGLIDPNLADYQVPDINRRQNPLTTTP